MINELATLQAEIDALDDRMIALLRCRFDRSRRIGTLKQEAGMAPSDPKRIAAQQRHFIDSSERDGLDREMAKRIIVTIIDQVVAERSNLGASR